MASKKDKILESAQRYVLKGQIDKAIKDYQTLVSMEPTEVRHRQRLAELLVRDHRKEEAIQQYEVIGKHYADNSYFLKAIAIYKQIQRLSPGNTAVTLTIASLNHQQGLIGNALAEYGQVAAQLEKEGTPKEALKVVEKMLGVDADHSATRLKYAELLFTTGAKEASWDAFNALYHLLISSGHGQLDAEAVSVRMRQLFPEQQAVAAVVAEPAVADAHLALDAFGPSDQIPGVTEQAPWEQAPSPAATASGQGEAPWEAPPAADPPDAFAAPFETPEAPSATALEEFPSAFGEATSGAAATEGNSCWEEEIELDLDDDLPGLEFSSTPVPGLEHFVVPSAPPAGAEVAAADAEMDLHMDFSLELDFDEVPESSADAAQDQEAPAAELDLALDLSSESGLPQAGDGFGEMQRLQGAEEPEDPERIEEAVELEEHAELLEWADVEELGVAEMAAEPEAEVEAEPEADVELEWPDELDIAEPVAEAAVSGWEEIYPAISACDAAQLDIEELESHYDLGIGYKEMGMYSGAIKEFDVAAQNPQRRLDCLTLQAICHREQGAAGKAEELLRRGLALGVLSLDERICLSYELAVLLESTGGVEEAIELYREVRRANPGYHDVSSRLSALSGEEEYLDIIDLELEEGY